MKQSLVCEFNRVQQERGKETCSERSVFRWLKEDRPKHAVCPPRTDYCDKCKELKEEINHQATILQRLRHAGNSSDVQLLSHERLQKEATENLAEHKGIAQKALEHYRFTVPNDQVDPPHWGYSDRPGISYYLHKVSHDDSKYVAAFEEQIGPKISDHTVSIL